MHPALVRISLNTSALALATVIIASVFFAQRAAADAQCPAGQRPATADDVAKGLAAAVGTSCVDNATALKLNGGCDFDPYPVINGFRSGNSVLLAPQLNSNGEQDGINPILACRIAQFLQYAKSQGHTFTITSGFRSAAYQTQICMSMCGRGSCPGTCAPAGTSCHQYGLAVDISGSASDMAWAHSYLGFGSIGPGASAYKIFFPLTSDAPHIQCVENPVAGCNVNTVGCGGSNFQITPGPASNFPIAQNQTIYTTPGLGTSPQPGQIVAQDTACYTSLVPIVAITIPAGSVYPSGCLNPNQGASSLQAYCVGNTIAYNVGGTITTGQACAGGCLNGQCLNSQTCAAGSISIGGVCVQQQCPSGQTSYNGICVTQQCPAGYASMSGTCAPVQTAQTPVPQQVANSGLPASSVATNPTTGTVNGTNATTPTILPLQQPQLTTPTLIPNLRASNQSLEQQLENIAQSSGSATTSSGTTNSGAANGITTNAGGTYQGQSFGNAGSGENAAASSTIISTSPGTIASGPTGVVGAASRNISQLQPSSMPGVTYAEPTSAIAGENGYAGNAAHNAPTTTAGTGYALPPLSSSPAQTETSAQETRSGADTFAQPEQNAATASPPYAPAPLSSIATDAINILEGLKAELDGALRFLSTFAKPFGGNIPNQEVGD